jgi:hypothetical protein
MVLVRNDGSFGDARDDQAASVRQELTRLPFSRIVQAPQAPLIATLLGSGEVERGPRAQSLKEE